MNEARNLIIFALMFFAVSAFSIFVGKLLQKGNEE
jgi:hypothetical protein